MFSDKQIDSISHSDAKINIWEGAVRSGKTYASLYRYLEAVSEGPLGDYAFITRTYDSFKRNLLPQISRIIGADARHYSGKRELKIWGKTIHVVGADDDRAESKIRGSTFESAYVDEISIIPETVFRMLISRCAMGTSKIFGTTNPDSPYHWLKKDFLTDNPDVKSWAFTLEDNPQLTQDEKDYLRRQYKGVWYKRFIEGLWVQAEGAIYDFFDTAIHVIPHPPGLAEYYLVGVDYGTVNACSFVLMGVNRSKFPNIWVEDVYYYDSKAHQRQKTDSEYAEDFCRFITGKAVKAIYVDPSAASFKLEMIRHGVSSLYDADNDVLDGIRLTSQYIANGTLKICANCTHLIKEFQSYVWDPKSQITGIDKPLKVNDHCVTGDTLVCIGDEVCKIKEKVGSTGEIATFDGTRIRNEYFFNIRKTREKEDVFEIELEDGTKIKATGDHRFLTDLGWKELRYLSISDRICTWNTNIFKTSSFTKILKQGIGLLQKLLKRDFT